MSRKKKSDPLEDLTIMVIIVAAILMAIVYFSPWSWIVIGLIILAIIGNALPSTKVQKKASNKKTKTKGFLEMIEDDKKRAVEKKKQQLEKEMDNYGLSEEEKEIVRNSNGEYEPYQFDEEELEEDDYYSDDDVILNAFNDPNDKLP